MNNFEEMFEETLNFVQENFSNSQILMLCIMKIFTLMDVNFKNSEILSLSFSKITCSNQINWFSFLIFFWSIDSLYYPRILN